MPLTSNGMGKLATPERNRFFYGKLMDTEQFQKEQYYFNHKRSLVNRIVPGSGVVSELAVIQDTEMGGTLRIEPGLAIDGLGARDRCLSAHVDRSPATYG